MTQNLICPWSPIRLAGPLLRYPKAMRFQIRVESLIGQLLEVGGQPQALELEFAVVSRIRHGVRPPKPEVIRRTPTLPLSVVQTTETSESAGARSIGTLSIKPPVMIPTAAHKSRPAATLYRPYSGRLRLDKCVPRPLAIAESRHSEFF